MAVTIREKPFAFDFAGNRTRFLLNGSPVSVNGSKSKSVYKIQSLPSLCLVVSFAGEKYTFEISTPALARNNPNRIANYTYLPSLKSELQSKIAENYYIARHYDVTIDDNLVLTFVSKQCGADTVTVSGLFGGSISTISLTNGTARVRKSNYQMMARFEIVRWYEGSEQTIESPEMLLRFGEDNVAELPVEILRPYFSAADVPSVTETFAGHVLRYATLRYKLTYAEVFGDVPQVGVLKRSSELFLSAGCLEESHRTLNLPDWNTPLGTTKKFSECQFVRDFGSESGLTIRSYKEMPQFAYFMLFTNSKPASFQRSMQINVKIVDKNGQTFVFNPGVIAISNFSIVRIPLSVQALSLGTYTSDILSYTIYVENHQGTFWTRTFVLESKPFNSAVFFLQNRYGLLESLSADEQATEERTEGEQTVQNGVIGIDITDRSTIHTARSYYRSRRERQLVADAMNSRFNYRIVAGMPVPIAIVPDSLTVRDDNEDVLEIEFQYRFIVPNAGHGSNFEPITPDVPAVWADGQVWNDLSNLEDLIINPTLTI